MNATPLRQRNQYLVEGELAYLTIHRFNGETCVVTFDAKYLGRVRRYMWHISTGRNGGKYVMTKLPSGRLALSRLIINAADGRFVFHDNHDTFDCRLSNLREGSRADSRPRPRKLTYPPGTLIYWNKRERKFKTYAKADRKTIYIGGFNELADAISAQRKFLKEHEKQAAR